MKAAIKRENDEFFVITLKHVSCLTDHKYCPRTAKLWAIAHENGHKTWKWRVFFVIALKHVSHLTGNANRLGTPKPWAIAHENDHKTRKHRVFCHNSQTCIRFYWPYKSQFNPKTMGNNSWYIHKTWKHWVFGHNSQTCIGCYESCK